MTVSERIRQRRESLGISQQEFAYRMGYKARSVANEIESCGDNISLKKVEKAADALGTSAAYLLGWDEQAERIAEEDEYFLKQFHSLPEFKRKLVIDLINSLVD